jgi:hypothetical protein
MVEDVVPTEGLAGFQQILRDGEVIVGSGGEIHPRTAVGVDAYGGVLWLVVVDGRQPGYSEGMSLGELARFMRELGCRQATNLDGGGSSVMGLVDDTGRLRVVNSPSGRRLGAVPAVRPVPVILTVRTTSGHRRPGPGAR